MSAPESMAPDAAASEAPQSQGVRPLVGRVPSNRGLWLFVGLLAASGLGLFGALEARRTAITSPSITAPSSYTGVLIAAPPDLTIPAEPSAMAYAPGLVPAQALQVAQQAQPAQLAQPAARAQRQAGPAYLLPSQAMAQFPPQLPAPSASPGPAFAFQAPPRGAVPPSAAPSGKPGEDKRNDERAMASKLLNPATTVPLGTVIQAVMETAFDSTRSGFARAVVARDVTGFDGSHVLIPRGSKLFGEYKADIGYGQSRATIQWHRLTRPDGSIVDVDSPAADPLGRMGVKGHVNSHFLARFGGAILQTALDVGSQVATQRVTGNTYIVGLPNAVQNVQNTLPKVEDIKPTITLKQGASVTVFVGRDLDFTAVEQ